MARIGEIQCCNPACGCTDVAVHRTAGGKLSAKCHKCGTERWAPLGTRAHRDMANQTVMDEGEREAREPEKEQQEPPPKAAPVAAPKAVNSAFSLGAL